ncbi:M16 family metallopeptidase [Vibrio palustris]|uniref:Peptidase M16 inactive domain protein n=1 Tax=Vibrio palustris TaxID=1918946 RepID=A0A1R4AZL2_9VIBR|nr:pitrilysin family protein [Vibrio palustris]SJL82099.1 Peptidase M16 inactive domain protein [Vibrio palustris]
MKHCWLFLVAAMTLSGCETALDTKVDSLPSGITQIEHVAAKPGTSVIPYTKYRLDNGMTVILSPDHSDPLVHVDVTYHVGSAREDIGKSGFAHFFEHMMFQGSEHVGDQQHFKIVTEAGGKLNGNTTRDRTKYFETLPSNQLEKALWLESDRMGFLLQAVSKRKFEIQRSTVKNERAQNYDNRPYGLIWERLDEALFPVGHPYSWSVIGDVDDLNKVGVNDLKTFFQRWYGPNNAVLTIGGDLDSEQTLAWVKKYFGSIPKGPAVDNAPKQPVKLNNDRFITLSDRIQQPMLVLSWPTSFKGAQDQVAQDVLASAIGSGTNSLLYKRLIKTQKAVDAGAFLRCDELACTFNIYAMAPSGKNSDLTPLYHDVMAVLERFKQQGISSSKLEEITNSSESGAIFALQSVSGKVTELANSQTFYGNPAHLQTELERLRHLTKDDVMAVFDKYINGHAKVALSVIPHGKPALVAQKSNYTPPPRELPDYSKEQADEVQPTEISDDFDRSVMPQVTHGVYAHLPQSYHWNTANGMTIRGIEQTETPTVVMEFRVPAGSRVVPEGKEGLAGLTAALLKEGTTTQTAQALQAKLDQLGSSVDVSAGMYTTSIVVRSLRKNVSQTLAVMQDMLLHPKFSPQDFERLRQQSLQGAVYKQQSSSWMNSQAIRHVLFHGTRFARDASGNKDSLSSLTLADVKQFYQQYYTPNDTNVAVVGDITQTQARKALASFAVWQGHKAPPWQPVALPKQSHQSHIYLVDKPNAKQTTVSFVRLGPAYSATGERYKAYLANFNLAGNFNSRINLNLREDKGYTYGAFGYISTNKEFGHWVFSAEVKAPATADSIIEIHKEMAQYSQSGPTESDVKFMRLAVGQKKALSYETPGQKAQLLGHMMSYKLETNYLDEQEHIIKTIPRSTLKRLAHKWFDPNEYQIVVVGDAKTLKPQLQKTGLPVEPLEIIR